jgi:NADPH:quinone reductase-like Zn-dependent oxidoreductase
MMKVMQIHAYGSPLLYEEVPDPVPDAGEVLVRIVAAGVNPADWKIVSGKARAMVDYPMPLIPGGDVAGRIEAVGKGVTRFAAGDEVFGLLGLTGAYAERTVVDARHLAQKPLNITFEGAASLPLVALTAWQALFADGQQCAGRRILVHNAAGGVGSAAVQIAKANGGTVVGTASLDNADYVRGLGADEIVDFRTSRVEDFAGKVDAFLDLVGNEEAKPLWALVRPGGHIIRVAGGAGTAPRSEQDSRIIIKMTVRPDGGQLGEIAKLISGHKLRPEVAQTFPLAEADKAHALSRCGHVRGKLVLRMTG